MKIGFDNNEYMSIQSECIRERIAQFGGKLYLEFGGKLFDDFHASRVLPGFEPDSKIRMLATMKDEAEFVIVINAEKVTMTGKKLDRTMYYRHTGWLGHLKQRTARQFQEADPTGFVEAAIKGMLPHNTLGRKQGMKLFVYAGSEHPHAAQKPETLEFKG